jgi:hypothetical protein
VVALEQDPYEGAEHQRPRRTLHQSGRPRSARSRGDGDPGRGQLRRLSTAQQREEVLGFAQECLTWIAQQVVPGPVLHTQRLGAMAGQQQSVPHTGPVDPLGHCVAAPECGDPRTENGGAGHAALHARVAAQGTPAVRCADLAICRHVTRLLSSCRPSAPAATVPDGVRRALTIVGSPRSRRLGVSPVTGRGRCPSRSADAAQGKRRAPTGRPPQAMDIATRPSGEGEL